MKHFRVASEKTFVRFERADSATEVLNTLLARTMHALGGGGDWLIELGAAAVSPQLGTSSLAVMNTQK